MSRKQPEASYVVSVSGDDVRCLGPDGGSQAVSLKRLRDVYVETNESGLWGVDVWFVLRDDLGQQCSYPLGATGEAAVLDRLRALPGFRLDGMNSTANARFLCWRRDDDGSCA
jgi:hypothetical protein